MCWLALFTADGLFDVELKELDRQRHTEGFGGAASSQCSAIQSKAKKKKSYFNFLEVGSFPVRVVSTQPELPSWTL